MNNMVLNISLVLETIIALIIIYMPGTSQVYCLVCPSDCLSVLVQCKCPFVLLTVCLSFFSVCLSLYLSLCHCTCLSVVLPICLSLYLSVYPCTCLSVLVTVCLSLYLSVYPCICPSFLVSACLSVLVNALSVLSYQTIYALSTYRRY